MNFNLRPSQLAFGNRQVHYAWVIVAAAALMRLGSSSFRTSSSILIPRLVETFGWSYGMVGLAFSLQWWFTAFYAPPPGGRATGKEFGYTMLWGAFLFVIGMVLTATVNSLWEFYLYFGIILSAAMGIFQVPLTAGVTQWFHRRLGVGMGLLQASQGLGPLVAVPLILLIIAGFSGDPAGWLAWIPGVEALFGDEEKGLRAAFWIPGIIGGLVLLALIRLFYDEPASIGLRPLGMSAEEPVRQLQSGEAAKARSKVFLKQVMPTTAFWNLIGIHYWGCAGHAIVMVFIVAMAEEAGVSKGLAAGTFIALTVTSTLTRFAVPILADHLGSKGVMGVCFFLQVAPVGLLFFADTAWMFYVFAILFGIGFGGEMTAFPIINRQYYGNAPIGTTYGFQMMGAGFGMASGAAIGGLLRDLTEGFSYPAIIASGDFTATIAASLALSGLGVVSIVLLPNTGHHQLPHWEDALPEEYRSSPQPNRAGAAGD
ncbi:MAG: MFS transporter [Chloroflexota bacterium]|nr:MFS transporter [Chloroflexota bacterium]